MATSRIGDASSLMSLSLWLRRLRHARFRGMLPNTRRAGAVKAARLATGAARGASAYAARARMEQPQAILDARRDGRRIAYRRTRGARARAWSSSAASART